MSAASQERQLKSSPEHVSWMEPKLRFYACLFVFLGFCVLQHWSWMFSLGGCATIALHAGLALFAGDMYMRTLSLKSPDVIFHRQDPAYAVALVIHAGILLLFLGTLLLRIGGL